ncbi:hypothetical protein [Pseudomonas viridiflava]|uniref:hypothetical protein n=1 Tax=Pseudomonas viridiflava TaxID=33069 RepID=UPI000F061EEB|nr:hypothetical protein [Pseudomonas viridiflava]
MREYERYQLDSIASEYRSRGYVVDVEAQLPDTGVRFDAIARRGDDKELVFVEIVNPRLSDDEIVARRLAIADAALRFPNALIDFRYIDIKQSAFLEFNTRDDNSRDQQFRELLKARFPVFNKKPKDAARQMLSLWAGYASLLRGLGRLCRHPESEEASILDLYNSFLQRRILVSAEATDDSVSHDLYQMHEVVIAATQGALVDIEYVKQLRGHYQALRKQAKDYSTKGWPIDTARW